MKKDKKRKEFEELCSEFLIPRIAAMLERRLDGPEEMLDLVARQLARIEAVVGSEGEPDLF